MVNPVLKACEERGMSVTQLAILADVDDSRVRQYLNGQAKRLSGKVLHALDSLGFDGQRLESEYDQWRSKRREEIRMEVLN